MGLESKTKIEKFLNGQSKEIEVNAKEFLEIYMSNISNEWLRGGRNSMIQSAIIHQDGLEEMEETYESLKKKLEEYERKYK